MLEKIKVWAFENKNEPGRFLCDGIDCEDSSHENGDVTDLSDALIAVRKDLEEPTEKDLEDFQKMMRSFKVIIDWAGDVEPNYNPKIVELTKEQIAIWRERNND